ncbi:MAG: NAD(P)-dependent oxidoreductase, partial [Candidatus Hadarchaeota archaeon]
MKVLVSDSIPDDVVKTMQQEGLSVDVNTGLSQEELISIIPEYDALVVRSGTQVTEEVINAAKNLRFIGRAGVGVDNIDVNAATQQGIIVANAPGGNTVSAAEQTLALLLALARGIPLACKSVKEGKWERKKFLGTELRGKTLGVIGLGRIGFEVARRAVALEMNVIGYDPYISKDRTEDIGVKLAKLDEV